MKHFKECGFWILFAFIVLAGSLLIVNLSFQKQLPGIPDVNAQTEDRSFPGDTYLLPHRTPGYFQNFAAFPGDTFYTPSPPSKVPGNPNDDYYMPSVGTISTASTCARDCGHTYTTCSSTCGRGAQGRTLMTCSSGMFGNCFDQTPTSTTCSGSIFCGGIPMPTSSTCSGSIFCDGGPMPTSSTCSGGIFCDGGPMPTSSTCSGSIFCGGGPSPTLTTCSGGIFCDGGPSPTFTTCSGGIFCGGPSPTSTTCGIFCDGGPSPTFTTCSGGIFCGGSNTFYLE